MRALLCAAALLLFVAPAAALADGDESPQGVSALAQGLQPLSGPIPAATPLPSESSVKPREDGAMQAMPDAAGTTKTFHLVERKAPWTLFPGLTVMARTYNGVVPGPVLQVNEGDRVVIDYRNASDSPDVLHLHGIRGTNVDQDGVPGISQALVRPGGSYRYEFTANQPGTFIYHTHGTEAMLQSGLYGAIIVLPKHPRPAERANRDYLQLISSWTIQSGVENHFTLNGKEYPATKPLEVRAGERVRIRWINISGEEWHTMHTHGHDQHVIARDARAVPFDDVQDTIALGPGQRADVIIEANAKPGTWLIHCHVGDHVEDAHAMPAGLITALHYTGTPNTFASMTDAMMPMMTNGGQPKPLGMWRTLLLGAIAGLTIFLGVPIARARKLSQKTIAVLNAVAIGILVFLVVEISQNATRPLTAAFTIWHAGQGPLPVALTFVYAAGLLIGLVGLGGMSLEFMKRNIHGQADHPLALSTVIAIGIGAHNFGEGLAIGASAATGATALAIGLIVGFALHNATEGFGIAAPMAGKMVPSWTQIGIAGVIAGGPTFLGTLIGYLFNSPLLSVFFLTIAAGALIFVIGELWGVLRRSGITKTVTTALACGFFVALATEMIVDLSGG